MRWIYLILTLLVLSIGVSPPAQAIDAPVSTTLQNAATATGDGTAASVAGYASIGVQVVISDTATVTFESTVSGSTWVATVCTLSTDGAQYSSTTASGLYQCNVAGYNSFRARISAYTGGTVTVTSLATVVSMRAGASGGITGWPTSSANKEATWANSLANALCVGDGTRKVCLYGDATNGPVVRGQVSGADVDSNWRCWTDKNCVLYDVEGAAAIETIDPDAASTLAMYTYGANYRPKKSVWFGAGALSTDGTQCAAPAEATPLASGVKLWTIICADNDGSRMHGSVVMPDNWDAGTLTFESTAVQTAASAGVIEYQVAAQCKGDTEALVTTASYGSEVVWTDTLTGSSGVNRATSGAVTPSGTCAAGDFLAFYIDIGAANTTTAMATLHTFGFKMEYSETSRSQ